MVKVAKSNGVKDLESILGKINSDFGEGSIMRLGDAGDMKIERISTGALTLDLALGGGLPKGRIVEVFGDSGSAKTTLSLHVIAEAQKLQGNCAFLDVEHAIDPTYAKALGVDIDNLFISQPDSGEATLDICLQLVESNEFSVIVVDSVAALVPRSELEGDMGDASMGVMARLMSQAMRKLTGPISKSGCTVIFINQERDMINSGGYGPRTTTCGGKALKFYASVRIDVTRIQTLKKGNEEYGIRVKAKVIKNKTAPPMKVAEYDVIFGQGISAMGCIVDLAEELNIISRKGAWYSYEGSNVGQGRENTVQWLKDNPTKAAEIEEMIKMMLAPAKDEAIVVEEVE
jgi:recombination protein RecA